VNSHAGEAITIQLPNSSNNRDAGVKILVPTNSTSPAKIRSRSGSWARIVRVASTWSATAPPTQTIAIRM
jgi:hypothetical protein